MTVYDFLYVFNDDYEVVRIYDTRTEEEVFVGTIRDAMYCDYEGYEVDGVDLDKDGMIITIETDEEDTDEEDEE